MDHPTSETLSQFLDGTLVDPAPEAIAAHLDTCTRCQALTDDLLSDVSLDHLRVAAEASFDHGPALQRVIHRLVGGSDSGSTDTDDPPESAIDPLEMLDPGVVDGDLGSYLNFRVLRVLGTGGVGVVFEAIDPKLERLVALKVLRPDRLDAASVRRFLQEARAAAMIRHPNVVVIHEVNHTPGSAPYLAMEHCDGGSLRNRIRAHGPLAPGEAADLCAQAADGLAAAHEAGLVHRDIKPANILLARSHLPDVRTRVARLADFGLARPVESTSTLTIDGMLCGTPGYLSPERVRDPASQDPRADVFSLGVTLYECLTGEVPFRGSPAMVLQQVLTEEPRPPGRVVAGIPRDLETICLTAMAREPERRYATARAFADDLRRWLRGEPIVARPASALERLARWARRNPRIAAMAATTAALLVTTTVVSITAALVVSRAQRETVRALASARAQRALALDTLNSLIFRVQRTLGERPGMLELRQKILSDAITNLELIAREEPGLNDTDRSTLVALQRLSEALILTGRHDEARSYLERSLRMAEATLRQTPSDSARIDLATSHDKLGMIDQHSRRFDQAGVHYRAARSLFEEASAHQPNDLEFARQAIAAIRREGDLLSLNSSAAEALRQYDDAILRAERLLSSNAENVALQREIVITRRRAAALCGTLNRANDGRKHLERAAELIKALLQTDPENVAARHDLAGISGDLGWNFLYRREPAAAIPYFEAGIAALEANARANPGNSEMLWDLAHAYRSVGFAHFARADYDRAGQVIARGIEILEDLARRYPSAEKYPTDAVIYQYSLANVYLRQGNTAAVSTVLAKADATLETVLRRHQGPSAILDAIALCIREVNKAVSVFDRVLQDESALAAQPTRTRRILAAAGAVRLAETAPFSVVRDRIAMVEATPESIPLLEGNCWFEIARAYARLAARLPREAKLSDAERARLRAEFAAKAKEAVEKSKRLNPSITDFVTLEPDFDIFDTELRGPRPEVSP
ncbi:MAG: protein kinase [Isosphaeraceae bacterium]